MKLTGHKTFSQFEKYISVNKEDKLKAGQLYRQKNTKVDVTENELLNIFSSIQSEDDKKLLLQMARKFLN
jgi:ABC-type transporter Mla subunit MlaD